MSSFFCCIIACAALQVAYYFTWMFPFELKSKNTSRRMKKEKNKKKMKNKNVNDYLFFFLMGWTKKLRVFSTRIRSISQVEEKASLNPN